MSKSIPSIPADKQDAIVADYRAGLSRAAVAAKHGVSETAFRNLMKARREPMRSFNGSWRKSPKDVEEAMVAAYSAGLSANAAAAPFGLTGKACRNALKRRGLELRERTWPEDQKSVAVEAVRRGESLADAASLIGCSVAVVAKWADAVGVSREKHGPGKRWTEEEAARFVEVYPKIGLKATALEFGRSVRSICKRAEKTGLKSEVHHKLHGETQAAANTSCDVHFFEQWSPDMAYILGYIWADGCIVTRRGVGCTLSLICTRTDEPLLASIREVLQSTHAITRSASHRFISTNGVGYVSRPASQLRICSRVLVDCLIARHGLGPRKSSSDYPYPHVPDEFLPHFARGNFDGDGSVSHKKRSVQDASAGWLGSPAFILGLQQQICRMTGLWANPVQRRGKIARFCWYRKADLTAVYRWMYPIGDYLCLGRKREKFRLIVEHLERHIVGRSRRRLYTT